MKTYFDQPKASIFDRARDHDDLVVISRDASGALFLWSNKGEQDATGIIREMAPDLAGLTPA